MENIHESVRHVPIILGLRVGLRSPALQCPHPCQHAGDRICLGIPRQDGQRAYVEFMRRLLKPYYLQCKRGSKTP